MFLRWALARLLLIALMPSLTGLVLTACGTGTRSQAGSHPISLDAVVTATEQTDTFHFTFRSVLSYKQHTMVGIDESGVVNETEDASESITPASSGGPGGQVISIGHDVWSRDLSSVPGRPSTPWMHATSSADNGMVAEGGIDPRSFLGQLAALGGHLVYAGPARIGDVETSHYRLVVVQKLHMTEQMRQGIRGNAGKRTRTVVDLWIDHVDVLRKVTETTSVVGGDPKTDAVLDVLAGGTVTGTFSDFGAATSIAPPSS